MVTIANRTRVFYIGGSLQYDPSDINVKTVYELKADLSGWEVRPELELTTERAWIKAASYEYQNKLKACQLLLLCPKYLLINPCSH